MKTLTDIIYQYENNKFSWGKFDCATFSVGVLEEYRNKKVPQRENNIKYNDYKSAMKSLKNLGCKEVLDLPSVLLNTPKKDISEVKLGDIVYYINEDKIGVLGICNGVRAYFLQEGKGLTARPIEDCIYCWSTD